MIAQNTYKLVIENDKYLLINQEKILLKIDREDTLCKLKDFLYVYRKNKFYKIDYKSSLLDSEFDFENEENVIYSTKSNVTAFDITPENIVFSNKGSIINIIEYENGGYSKNFSFHWHSTRILDIIVDDCIFIISENLVTKFGFNSLKKVLFGFSGKYRSCYVDFEKIVLFADRRYNFCRISNTLVE